MFSLATLGQISRELRNAGRTVVLANGCFDLPHAGHIQHLQAAKRLGDVLMVTITQDAYVGKGPDRPLFGEHVRAGVIAALECVDYVAINDPRPGEAIRLLVPDIYVKGSEYENKMTPQLIYERRCIEEIGGVLVFTREMECHSTDLVTRVLGELTTSILEATSG